MKVQAKFTCNSIIEQGNYKTVNLNAVYSNGKGNEDFAKATPAGSLSMSIDKDVPASDYFKQGKDYFLTFEEAE